MILPEAIFDILFIGQRVEKKMTDFSISEINFFSYMSCLLSVYEGNPTSSWRINFIKSDFGSPFSKEINDALIFLKAQGLISSHSNADYFNLTKKGIDNLELYSSFETLIFRTRFLDAACKTMSLVPYGMIKDALKKEPVLMSASLTADKRMLLNDDTPATKVLFEQLRLLHLAVGHQKALLIPAITWIESLNINQRNV